MPSHRSARTAELIHKELAALIRQEVKDPRVGEVSITHVALTRDRRFARVYLSPLGGVGDPDGMVEGLKSASGYLRRRLGKLLRLQFVPELTFIADEGVDHSVAMTSLLDRMSRERADVEGEE